MAIALAERNGGRRRPSTAWVLVAVSAAFIVPNVLWIWRDHRVWSFDQSWYGEVATDLWFILTADTKNWGAAVVHAMPSKPPLLVWLSQFMVPLRHVFGGVDRALLLFILAQQVLSIGFLWAALRELRVGAVASGAAVLFFAGAPLSVGLTHQFFVEPLQTTIVTASLWLAVTARRCTPLSAAALLLLLAALSLATKTTTFLYCAFFWLVAAVSLLRRVSAPGGKRFSAISFILLAIAIGASVLTFVWYKVNLSEVLDHVRASTGADALLYGRSAPLLAKLLTWQTFGSGATSIYPGLLAVILIASGQLVALLIWARGWRNQRVAILLAALGHIAIVTLTLAAQPNEETRFLLPLLIDIAVIIGFAVDLSKIAASFACAIFGVQILLVDAQAAGYPLTFASSAWLLPVHQNADDLDAAKGLLAATCSDVDAWRINIIAPEFPHMNANSMSFLAAKRRLDVGFRCSYTSLGYASKDVEASLRRIDEMNVKYVVLPAAARMPAVLDPFNQVLAAATERLLHDPAYQVITQIDGYLVVLVKRNAQPRG